MLDKGIQMQAQIRENNLYLQEYRKDLDTWEKDIKKKDRQLKSKKPTHNPYKTDKPPHTPEPIPEQSTESNKEKLKRDKNDIKGYYAAWDNFDVEKEVENVEKGLAKVVEDRTIINNDKLQIEGKEVYGKTGSAKPNSQIIVKGGRKKLYNQAEELKIEGNNAISSYEYSKAIEKYTQAIKIANDDELICTLYSNRSQAYINLKQYIDAENDTDMALKLNPKHIKSLHRRAIAKYSQLKLKEAENDLMECLSMDKSNEDAKVKLVMLRREMDKKRVEILERMKSNGKYYNGTSHAIPIMEIDS